MNRRKLMGLTQNILSIPTASFREHGVRAALEDLAKSLHLPTYIDDWGNLHVTYKRGRQRFRHLLLAHLDHPGFIVTEDWRGGGRLPGQVWCRWFGRVAESYFVGARVKVQTASGPVSGTITAIRSGGSPRRVEWIRVLTPKAVLRGDFGSWDLPSYSLRGDRLATRSADDLVGCSVLAALLATLAQEKPAAWVEVVYTRAEEAGLVGATSLAESHYLPKETPVLALEASMAMPGAILGSGPVIRTGDLASCFDPGICHHLIQLAAKLKRQERQFRFQRCLMDGGTTEASAFAAFGYRAAGLAFPMLNYHNQGQKRITTEEVDVTDLTNGLALLKSYVTTPWPREGWPAPADQKMFRQLAKSKSEHLKESRRHGLVHWKTGPGRKS